jgi:hypothetical protein
LDDPTVAKLLQILRTQAVQIGDLCDQVSALLACLNQLPDFQKSFDAEKQIIQTSTHPARQATIARIEEMIQSLKKSN